MSDEDIDIIGAIELIECARHNLTNIQSVGLALIPLVRIQLDSAIRALGDEPIEDEDQP